MNRIILLLCFLLFGTALIAQEVERTLVKGKISTVGDDDLEGITLYNTSSQKGTVTDAEGAFEIELAANDRVYITALQFQAFTVIIDKGVIESKTLNIYLNPAVTQLDEVIVRPYDLTGNVRVDVREIPTMGADLTMDLSYEAMEFGYGFKDDTQSRIQSNAAEEALNNQGIQNGANILGIVGSLVGMLFKNREVRKAPAVVDRGQFYNALRQRFSNEYIETTFQIPEPYIGEFLYFVEDSGLDASIFREANELRLVELLFEQSKRFRESRNLD